jgi:sugar phosphate isomerase/epimerase
MKFGCCISIDNILKAKEFGYDFIELSAKDVMEIKDSIWETTKKQILKSNITVIGFNAFCDERNPIVGPNVNIEKLTQYLSKVIKRAADLKCQNIGIGAPTARILPESFSYETATTQMKHFLDIAARKASKYNMTILYEAINPKECNFGTSTHEIYNLVKELNIPNLKIVWDVFHSINSGEQYEELTNIFNQVEHVHICSWSKDLKRFYPLQKDKKFLHELCIYLASQQYDKTISIEAPDSNFENDGLASIKMYHDILNAITPYD